MSYAARLGSIINDFRNDELGRADLGLYDGPSVVDRVKVPWTYCWPEAR